MGIFDCRLGKKNLFAIWNGPHIWPQILANESPDLKYTYTGFQLDKWYESLCTATVNSDSLRGFYVCESLHMKIKTLTKWRNHSADY